MKDKGNKNQKQYKKERNGFRTFSKGDIVLALL